MGAVPLTRPQQMVVLPRVWEPRVWRSEVSGSEVSGSEVVQPTAVSLTAVSLTAVLRVVGRLAWWRVPTGLLRPVVVSRVVLM